MHAIPELLNLQASACRYALSVWRGTCTNACAPEVLTQLECVTLMVSVLGHATPGHFGSYWLAVLSVRAKHHVVHNRQLLNLKLCASCILYIESNYTMLQ